MGYFKVSDEFIRVHARKLSPSAVSAFMVLACHANKQHKTTIGVRKIAELLGLSKTTVVKALGELKVYQLLVQRTKGVYQIRMPGVPVFDIQVYQNLEQKEYKKEDIKEESFNNLTTSPRWEELRRKYQPA